MRRLIVSTKGAATLLAASGLALLASYASASDQVTHSPKAQKELSEALAGRVAGQPVDCINNFRDKSRMTVIDDWTILYRESGVVYVQKPPGGCSNLSRGTTVLVTRLRGSEQLCAGDINQIVDQSSGIFRGSCAFGPFVPYRKGG